MVWFKVDDGLHDHRKVRTCGDMAAMGLWLMAGSWASDNRTDGFVPAVVLRRWSTSWRRLSVALVAAGLWRDDEVAGEAGYRFVNWREWQPEANDVATEGQRRKWRRAAALKRDRQLCAQVVDRDRDLCRYCGARVNWNDRRGKRGACYDHVNPDGDNVLANVVVACRGCNSGKGDRTPHEAGMALLPPPSDLGPIQVDLAPIQVPEGTGSRDGTGPGRNRVGNRVGSRSGKGRGPAPDDGSSDAS